MSSTLQIRHPVTGQMLQPISNQGAEWVLEYNKTLSRVRNTWASFILFFSNLFALGVVAYLNKADATAVYVNGGIVGVPFLVSGCCICSLANQTQEVISRFPAHAFRVIENV